MSTRGLDHYFPSSFPISFPSVFPSPLFSFPYLLFSSSALVFCSLNYVTIFSFNSKYNIILSSTLLSFLCYFHLEAFLYLSCCDFLAPPPFYPFFLLYFPRIYKPCLLFSFLAGFLSLVLSFIILL